MRPHIVVPKGLEQEALAVLTAGQPERSPECPECGGRTVSRVLIDRRDPERTYRMKVGLLWRYAPGTSPDDEQTMAMMAEGERFPHHDHVEAPRGGRLSALVDACVRCDDCGGCGDARRFWPKDA